MNERILCLDIGDVRIGVAVSDLTRTIAQPVTVITRVGYGPDVKKVAELCQSYDTVNVLSGLPLNMDGTEGFQAKKVREFCQRLQEAGLNVFFQDERLTTVTAEEALLEGNMRREERKQNVDKVAAAIILSQWLDRGVSSVKVYYKSEATNMSGMDEKTDLIELVDESGETVYFEHLMTLEHEGEYYIVLMTPETANDEDEGEVVVLQLAKDDKGEDCYVTIEDDETAQAVYEKFIAIIEEDDDAIPEDEDEEETEDEDE